MPTIAKGNTEIKVACLECIRGHRSSQCAHVNKILIEVRKPGRPLNMSLSVGSLPGHLQPAYVVSGHSRCQCPKDGVIPESDWKETDPTAYPKGKGSEHAFRVGKTGPKVRPPRISALRKESSSFSGINPIDLASSSSSSSKTPNIAERTNPSAASPSKPSCCHTGSTSNKSLEDSVAGNTDISSKEVRVDKIGPEPFATRFSRVAAEAGQYTALAQPIYSNSSQAPDIKPNMQNYYTHGPLKVEYNFAYNGFAEDDFKVFIDSHSPAELREKFPWKREIHPPPRTMHHPDSLDDLNSRKVSGDSSQSTTHISNQIAGSPEDGCCCGDDCSCLGCAVHPANATTMNHVREATEFMQNDPHYSDETALDREHIAAIFQARQDSKGAIVYKSSSIEPSSDTNYQASQIQMPVNLTVSTQENHFMNADGLYAPVGGSGIVHPEYNFSESASHSYPQTGNTHAGPEDLTLPPIIGLAHVPLTNSTGGILPHLRGTSQEPYATMTNDLTAYDSNDAFLFSGYGDDQHAYALHPISGNDQVFVMSQSGRPACVDDHGYCQCGPDCACDGCQIHKGSQTAEIKGQYSNSGSGQSSFSEAGLRGGGDPYEQPTTPDHGQTELDWTRLEQASDFETSQEPGYMNGYNDLISEIS